MTAGIRVKICGLTNVEDALAAVEAGADAIGLVFAESRRQIDVAEARRIVVGLPPFVTAVGLFADAPVEQVRRTAEQLGLHVVQLHGNESPDQVTELQPLRVIKAIGMGGADSVEQVRRFLGGHRPGNLAAVLLDTMTQGGFGGTGQSFDWSLAAKLPAEVEDLPPVILAGGLTAENVAEAVRLVKPYAVDVSSGVEAGPGQKDHAKMKQFVLAARRALEQPDESSEQSR